MHLDQTHTHIKSPISSVELV